MHGVAYDAKIYPFKVLNAAGSGSYSNLGNAITGAINAGVDIINYSLGSSDEIGVDCASKTACRSYLWFNIL